MSYDADRLQSTRRITSQNYANFRLSMPVAMQGQWGAPNGGACVAERVFTPTATQTLCSFQKG